MRTFILTALVVALATGACDDDTTSTMDDGGTDDVAREDTATPEDVEVPEDVVDLVEDVGEEGDSFTCPDVTPEDVTLTHVQPMTITVDIQDSGYGAGVSTAICRYEPPFEWATRRGEADACRVLEWLPVESLPTGANLDTGDVTVEIGETTLTVGPVDSLVPCYRPTTGGPVSSAPAGTTVRVWSTGGADVPAFELTTTVPELPAVAAPTDGETLTACLPWTVAWTAAEVSDVSVEFRTNLADDRHFAISCRGLTESPLVIPAELTALWTTENDHTSCGVRAVNRVVSTTDPVVTLEVTHGTLLAPLVTIERP